MAALATQTITTAAITPTYASAAGGGDTFTNDGATFLHVKNGGGGSITVTITSSGYDGPTPYKDQTVTVSNGSEKMIKPYPPKATGTTTAVGYSGVTSVTVAAIQYV